MFRQLIITSLLLLAIGATGAYGQTHNPSFDTLIAQFTRGDVECQEAVDSFRVYYRADPENDIVAFYLGRAILKMVAIGNCGTEASAGPNKSPLSLLDSAISYCKVIAKRNPSFRDPIFDQPIGRSISGLFYWKALWRLYSRDVKGLTEDLKQCRAAGGFSDALLAYSRTVLNELPPNAIYIGTIDDDLFPVMYVQLVEGARQDVSVSQYALLEYPWYEHCINEGISSTIPAVRFFQVPETLDTTKFIPDDEKLELAQAGASDIAEQFSIDSSMHGEIEEAVGHPVSYGPLTNAFRVADDRRTAEDAAIESDIFARIIRENKWRRPVYFSQALAKANMLRNIEPYLREEGFVARLFPDSGSAFNVQQSLWLDTTRFLRAVDSALVLLTHADSVIARKISAIFLNKECNTYLAQLMGFIPKVKVNPNIDTASMLRFLTRLGPIARSNPDNAVSDWALLALGMGPFKTVLADDAKWIRSVVEREAHEPGWDTTYNKAQLYYLMALLGSHECDAVRKFVDAKVPPADEDDLRYYQAMLKMKDLCE